MGYFNYSRRKAVEVYVGGVPLGGENPVRLQSMTNTSTRDTEASADQAQRIVEAGGEYVRLTTQGVAEAENLRNINAVLRKKGIMAPLVADVHFNPKVADVAARYAEKVRINPGNYVDPVKTFRQLEYAPEEYAREIEKIRTRFTAFLAICKANHTAIRIGVNHGSLSDRIMSRYGDTPEGMVESCMEFLRICVQQQFTDVVLSIKASNTIVMIRTVRLLVKAMEQEKMFFPLHLGVTEAGDGEDGRVKSAFGIGALLADGLGDTIRVSLSEAPEREIPVARTLRDYITGRQGHPQVPGRMADAFDFFNPVRRPTVAVKNIGGNHPPVVLSACLEGEPDTATELRPDYIYTGSRLPAERIAGTDYLVDALHWREEEHTWPVFNYQQLLLAEQVPAELKFVFLPYAVISPEIIALLKRHPEMVIISQSDHPNRLGEHRGLLHVLMGHRLTNPVIFFQQYSEADRETLQVKAAADMGPLIFEGFCDGIFLFNDGPLEQAVTDSTAFAILQAGRVRISKTEYISCPGCGRTLFDLETTIARVKAATSHLKGLKIGIMGCIVNGPGEMADADYGYVGAGRGKISLYKGKTCVEKNIPEEEAVDRLIGLIRAGGDDREK